MSAEILNNKLEDASEKGSLNDNITINDTTNLMLEVNQHNELKNDEDRNELIATYNTSNQSSNDDDNVEDTGDNIEELNDDKEEITDVILNDNNHQLHDTIPELNDNKEESPDVIFNTENLDAELNTQNHVETDNVMVMIKDEMEIGSDVNNDNLNVSWKEDDRNYRRYSLRRKTEKNSDVSTMSLPRKKLKKETRIEKNSGNTEIWECPSDTCFRVFNSKIRLENHLRHHDNTTYYRCALCQDEFKSNNDLRKHKKVKHSEKQSFMCMKCKLAFSDHCDFQIHNLGHRKQPYQCEECDMKTENKYGMISHIHSHYEKQFKCKICTASFCIEYKLNSHMKLHSEGKKECVECGKLLKTSKAYEYHMSSHTGVKPFQCPYCGKGFAASGQKTIHMRIHMNLKPFKCQLCPSTFRQDTDLRRHVVSKHDREKKYECDYCHKKFLHKQGVRVHVWAHINYKRYKCAECDQRFTMFGLLRYHTNYWHGNVRPFGCDLCGVKYYSKSHFSRHCRTKKHINKAYGEKLKVES